MRVVVGLGNPGTAYAASRHNVGFAVVDVLAQRWQTVLRPSPHGLCAARVLVAGQQVELVQPHMYMNRSGPALACLGHSIETQQLIVIHDELDLASGCVRVKRGGGTAGHHGLDSIVECYGADFTRVRLGVGRPLRRADAAEYVLSRVEGDEHAMLVAAGVRGADAVECILERGETEAMNLFNVRTPAHAAESLTGRK